MIKVNTVCVNGMGSSLILRMSVEKAFRELGVEAQVEAIDMGGLKGRRPDVVVTTPSLANSIEPRDGLTVIAITNFVDVAAIKEKIKTALNL
ncbi:MAG: PTS sugar transporter subunit IIB [Bacillota bacterium]